MAELRYMSAAELLSLHTRPGVTIIDVRDEERMFDGHIAGSLHYASETFEEKLDTLVDELKNKKSVIFHCALSQVRGPRCASLLLNHLQSKASTTSKGAPDVYVLYKGFNGWAATGHPVCYCKNITCCTSLKT